MFLCFQKPALKCQNWTKFRPPNLHVIRRAYHDLLNSDSTFDGPNKDLLNHLLECYKREKVVKPKSLKLFPMLQAIESIHKLDFRVTFKHNPKSIPGIDDIAALYITNFFSRSKDSRRKLVEKAGPSKAEEAARQEAIGRLQKLNGIGPIRARLLWESGCQSIGQLSENSFLDLLPEPARRIFEVYEKRVNRAISRKDAECFLDSLRKILPEEFEIILVGSYRLGHERLTEIDVLLLHPTYTTLPQVISNMKIPSYRESPNIYPIPPGSLLKESVMAKIKERGLDVTTFSSDGTHWDGLMKINDESIGRTRFYLMPMASKAAALLTFTGSPAFGNNCRQKARRKGLRLNEYGLWRSDVHGSFPPAGTTWIFLETSDEAALLRNLGIRYLEPQERDRSVKEGYPRVLLSEMPPWHITKYVPLAIRDVEVTAPAYEPKIIPKRRDPAKKYL